jgi:hypothetical protein
MFSFKALLQTQIASMQIINRILDQSQAGNKKIPRLVKMALLPTNSK